MMRKSVRVKPREGGGPGPLGAVAPCKYVVVMMYWHFIVYQSQLTKLCATALCLVVYIRVP